MSPPGKKCGVTTKLSVENASRSPGAGAGSTAASSPRSSSSPAYAAKNTSSMMRFIIVPPLPCPSMTVVSIKLLALLMSRCERMFHVKHRPSCKADEGFRSARDRSASRPRVLRAQGKANKWRDRAPRKPQRRPVPIAGRPPEPYTYICCPVVVTTRRPFFTPFVPRMRFAMSCTRPVSPRSTMTSRQWCASRCTCMDEMMDSK